MFNKFLHSTLFLLISISLIGQTGSYHYYEIEAYENSVSLHYDKATCKMVRTQCKINEQAEVEYCDTAYYTVSSKGLAEVKGDAVSFSKVLTRGKTVIMHDWPLQVCGAMGQNEELVTKYAAYIPASKHDDCKEVLYYNELVYDSTVYRICLYTDTIREDEVLSDCLKPHGATNLVIQRVSKNGDVFEQGFYADFKSEEEFHIKNIYEVQLVKFNGMAHPVIIIGEPIVRFRASLTYHAFVWQLE